MTTIVQAPIRRRKYLVFDVETTGLIPKRSASSVPNIKEYPHIIQLSFVLYDITEQTAIQTYNSYVNINKEVVISEQITNLTGITREMCETQGNPIIEIIYEFYQAYVQCDGLVAHNISFDESMILIEIERNREILMKTVSPCLSIFNPMYEKFRGIEKYCTMKSGTNICNIMVESKIAGKSPSKKWPKLIELYSVLFNGETVNGLHNSLVDVYACIRCYLKMRHNLDTPMIE
jgi:DNA polymerase III epsilon subunit-like protein